MSENPNPSQVPGSEGPPESLPSPEVPEAFPGQPAEPGALAADLGQPAQDFGQPAAGQMPQYETPAAYAPPGYPQPGYPQPGYQQPGYPQQGYPQQGFQQPGYPMAPGVEQKSKVAAGILGILLGSLGIHNFYLGFTKKALIQLLVSVLSFGLLSWAMAIWGLVEGILILIGNDGFRTDARGVPLKD